MNSMRVNEKPLALFLACYAEGSLLPAISLLDLAVVTRQLFTSSAQCFSRCQPHPCKALVLLKLNKVWRSLLLMCHKNSKRLSGTCCLCHIIQAVRYSFKEGLDEESLMLELGTACLEQDLAPMAQSVLARALLKRDSVQVCPHAAEYGSCCLHCTYRVKC